MVEVHVGSVKVGQVVLGVKFDGSLVVCHGAVSFVHELLDYSAVGEEFGGGTDVDGCTDVLEGCESVAHLKVDDGTSLQRRPETCNNNNNT